MNTNLIWSSLPAMKCFIWILLPLKYGVFGADEMKAVTEGDHLTLQTGFSEIQGDDRIVWLYGSDTIARIDKAGGIFDTYDVDDGRFSGKLELDKQTGSLIIKDIRIKNAGDYQLEKKGIKAGKFKVTVYARLPTPAIGFSYCPQTQAGSSKKICGVQCSVQTVGLANLSWYKGNSSVKTTRISDTCSSTSLRLEVDYDDKNTYNCIVNNPISNQTQHLDIFGLCQPCADSGNSGGALAGIVVGVVVVLLLLAAAAGVYYCKMSEQKKQIDSIKPEPVEVEEGDFALLSSGVTEIQEGYQMLWTFKDKKSLIASISKNDKKTYYYDDKRFRGRLQLDPQTGSLIIRNLRKTDSGLYQLQIKSKGGKSYRKYQVTVFGEMTTMQVKEGQDVILRCEHINLLDVFNIKWFTDEGCIAYLTTEDHKTNTFDGLGGRFKGKLELDKKTGFLKIKNIRPEHTGVYKVRSDRTTYATGTFNIRFDDSTETWSNESETAGLMGRKMCVFSKQTDGKATDEMKTVLIKEGKPLNLNTETEIQTDDEVLLMFGTIFKPRRPYEIIARINKQDNDEFKFADKKFEKLKLDHAGSLTISITNPGMMHCGDYYVQITNKKNKSFKTFTFIVSVKGVFGETVTSIAGQPVTIFTYFTEKLKVDQILWTFGPDGIIIANIKDRNPKCDFDKRFKGRLKLDHQTGSLTITNTRTTDSGLYHLHTITGKKIRKLGFNVTIQRSPQSTVDETSVPIPDDFEPNRYESDTLLNNRADGVDDQEATSSM